MSSNLCDLGSDVAPTLQLSHLPRVYHFGPLVMDFSQQSILEPENSNISLQSPPESCVLNQKLSPKQYSTISNFLQACGPLPRGHADVDPRKAGRKADVPCFVLLSPLFVPTSFSIHNSFKCLNVKLVTTFVQISVGLAIAGIFAKTQYQHVPNPLCNEIWFLHALSYYGTLNSYLNELQIGYQSMLHHFYLANYIFVTNLITILPPYMYHIWQCTQIR